MPTITNPIRAVFFPKANPPNIEFSAAVANAKTHQIARIAKHALFVLTTIAVATTLVLTEAAVITWPMALPAILVTLIAGALFFRLKKIDSRYEAGLDDPMRAGLAKKELENLFSKPLINKKQIERTLSDINVLFGCEIFSKEFRKQIADKGECTTIDCQKKWRQKGRYGLPHANYEAKVIWSGKAGDQFEVLYSRTEEKPEEAAPLVPQIRTQEPTEQPN